MTRLLPISAFPLSRFPLFVALLLSCVSWAQPPLPMPTTEDSSAVGEPVTHTITFSWSVPGRAFLDGIEFATTGGTNCTITADFASPRTFRVITAAGQHPHALRFTVEQITRWTGTLNESHEARGPYTQSSLKPGQRITGPSRFFAAVLSQQLEIVPWTSGPWAGPQY
jgi:hypothetical protein